MTIKPFTCPECGGSVTSHTGPGRRQDYIRGTAALPVPNDFDIPRCNGCGEEYPRPELEAELQQALHKEFVVWRANHLAQIVRLLTERHGATKAQIARICGISPSHLSHLLNPNETAEYGSSLTLVRLFECFAKCESEFARHLTGDVFDFTGTYPFEVVGWRTEPSDEFKRTSPHQWREANPAPDDEQEAMVGVI